MFTCWLGALLTKIDVLIRFFLCSYVKQTDRPTWLDRPACLISVNINIPNGFRDVSLGASA